MAFILVTKPLSPRRAASRRRAAWRWASRCSSRIREAIGEGMMVKAAALLGRPWAIEGVVQRGFARGRRLGFATANVALGDYVQPCLGIYAVRVRIDGSVHDGVASVGVNPTVGAL